MPGSKGKPKKLVEKSLPVLVGLLQIIDEGTRDSTQVSEVKNQRLTACEEAGLKPVLSHTHIHTHTHTHTKRDRAN